MSEEAKECLMLCRVRGTNYYLVVRGYGVDRDQSYYVGEHTCPANLLRHPCLYLGEDEINTDPHGMLEWVANAEIPPDFDLTFGFSERLEKTGIPIEDNYSDQEAAERWLATFPEIAELKKSPQARMADWASEFIPNFDQITRDHLKKVLGDICEKSGMELYNTPEGPRIRKK